MQFITITGYAATGQTAVLDLFKEFDDYTVPPHFEFRLIKDSYGILDLENFLLDNWDILRSNTAINDFLRFCQILNRNNNKLFQRGENYGKLLDEKFLEYSEQYIEDIIKCTYQGKSLTNEYYKNKFSFFMDKIYSKIFKTTIYNDMYIAQPSRELFVDKTQEYLEKIFYKLSQNETNTIVIDNAIPTSNIEKTLKYFKNIKMIIVDRDVRDTFVDLKRKKLLLGAELYLTEDVNKYIHWVKAIREKSNCELKNVLRIQFEDLILDYENTLEKIKIFIDDDIKHINKFEFLDPQRSKNNIGIWKKYPNQEIMKKILDRVPEYCCVKYD